MWCESILTLKIPVHSEKCDWIALQLSSAQAIIRSVQSRCVRIVLLLILSITHVCVLDEAVPICHRNWILWVCSPIKIMLLVKSHILHYFDACFGREQTWACIDPNHSFPPGYRSEQSHNGVKLEKFPTINDSNRSTVPIAQCSLLIPFKFHFIFISICFFVPTACQCGRADKTKIKKLLSW